MSRPVISGIRKSAMTRSASDPARESFFPWARQDIITFVGEHGMRQKFTDVRGIIDNQNAFTWHDCYFLITFGWC
jgi:hypothetical protein